jgi:TonB family protein
MSKLAIESNVVASSHATIAADREELFQLVKRSDVDPKEVETSDSSVVELSILWQTSILRVAHISQGATFLVSTTGTDSDSRMVLDESMLSATSSEMPVVRFDAQGMTFFFAPGSKGELELNGNKLSLTEALAQNLATAGSDGSATVTLRGSMRCKMILGGLTFAARSVNAPRKMSFAPRRDKTMMACAFGALALVGTAVSIGYYGSAESGSLVSDNQEDRMADIMGMMHRAAERAPEEAQPQPSENTATSAQGALARGDEGLSGRRESTNHNARLAVQNNHIAPQLSSVTARQQVAARGIFAALGAPVAVQGNSGPVNPFGGLESSGQDSQNAWGNLNGDAIGDAFGFNGLGRIGTGVGQGGNGEGTVCTGNCGLSTRGVGGGNDPFGVTAGSHLNRRPTRGPVVRAAVPDVAGDYSRELVRRVVQRNLAQIAHCHDQGLATNPDLSGRVVVSFVIGTNGGVVGSGVRESSAHSPSVESCIARAVSTWSFQPPQTPVTVNYPFMLERAL